jgi:hypothetical protein
MCKGVVAVVLSVGLGFFVVGCKAKPGAAAQSRIVQQAEDAGAGNIDKLSNREIAQWLTDHPAVLAKIGPECLDAMKAADRSWANTTEGRLCENSLR